MRILTVGNFLAKQILIIDRPKLLLKLHVGTALMGSFTFTCKHRIIAFHIFDGIRLATSAGQLLRMAGSRVVDILLNFFYVSKTMTSKNPQHVFRINKVTCTH